MCLDCALLVIPRTTKSTIRELFGGEQLPKIDTLKQELKSLVSDNKAG